NATTADVRKAYATIAKERHPDRFTDPVQRERAHEFFKEATAAFNALSNERSRRDYDAQIAKPVARSPEEHALLAFNEGIEYAKRGDAATAAERFRQAVYLAPREARYQAALGRVLVKDKHSSRDGIHALEEAIRLDPANAQAFHDLALVY